VGVGSEKRERGLASVSSSFPLYMDEDPYLGTVQAVAAAMRALASVGAKPIGLADGLNFGNPDKHREISAFSEAVRGLGDACRVWGIPIVSDSVSLYNGSESNPILPTPSLVMFGLIEDLSKSVGAGFKRSADKIFLLGTTRDEIGCSEYLFYCHERMIGAVPDIDFETELSVCSLVRSLVERQLIVSSHTLGLGGLGIALAESCLLREKALGASLIVRLPEPHLGPVRTDSLLFSESAGRFLVSFREENEQQLRELCQAAKVPITAEGTVGGKSIRLEGALKCELPLSTAKRIWEGGLNHILLDGQSLSL